MCNERRKKKTFLVTYQGDNYEIICSCHLFEFLGIIYEYAISVLIRNDVACVPDKYIVGRWRKDVREAHTRVAVNYDGLTSTPA